MQSNKKLLNAFHGEGGSQVDFCLEIIQTRTAVARYDRLNGNDVRFGYYFRVEYSGGAPRTGQSSGVSFR